MLCWLHSLTILSNRVCEWYVFIFLVVWHACICSPCEWHFHSSLCSQPFSTGILKIELHYLLPSTIADRKYDVSVISFFFLNPVYNLLFSQGDLGLSLCPLCSEILRWCWHDACSIFHISCLGLVQILLFWGLTYFINFGNFLLLSWQYFHPSILFVFLFWKCY